MQRVCRDEPLQETHERIARYGYVERLQGERCGRGEQLYVRPGGRCGEIYVRQRVGECAAEMIGSATEGDELGKRLGGWEKRLGERVEI